jgi:hypothetical protein
VKSISLPKRQSKIGESQRRHETRISAPPEKPTPDKVEESLDESFPASDPPSWTLSKLGSPK